MNKHILLLFLLIFAAACAPKSIESYHTGENEEEIVRLLNEREYAKAIWLVESRNGKNPADQKTAFLLGQAYLGKAGFEPLAVAAKVSGVQDFSSAEGQQLFPKCPTGSLGSAKNEEAVCLLKRVYFNVPDPDTVEFTRARELFRSAYPDAAASPEWVNVLIGMVETASCVKRAGNLYLMAKRVQSENRIPQDEEIRLLLRQAKRAIHEAAEAIKRAEHGGNKISQLLTGNHGVWFDRAKGAVAWADRIGLGPFFDLLREKIVSPSEEVQNGEALDKIRELLDEQEKSIFGA